MQRRDEKTCKNAKCFGETAQKCNSGTSILQFCFIGVKSIISISALNSAI